MPRVLFWSDSFVPQIGGVEVLAVQYLRALRERGCEFCILTRYEGEEVAEKDEFEGMPLYRLGVRAALASRSPLRLLQLKRTVGEIVRGFRPDLLHIYHVGMGVMLFDGVGRIPRLMTLHGHIPPEHLAPNTALATLLSSVDAIACCSRSVRESLLENVPELRDRSRVIANALEFPMLEPARLGFEPPRILALGRLVESKGFDVAIEALAALIHRFPTLQMTIAGDGPAYSDLKQQIESSGLQSHVSLPGWIAPERVPSLINAHTLVVVPSRIREAFGLVALQSAQMGRPVVASHIGGVPEVVQQGVSGLLVPQNDAPALAEAVASLLGEPERAQNMGLRARERALAHFTWEAHVAAYDELMASCLR